MTVLLVQKSRGTSPGPAGIQRVRGAVLKGHDLYLLLDFRNMPVAAAQTEADAVLLKVGTDEIGTFHKPLKRATMKRGELALAPSPVGCFERAADLPAEGISIQPRYLHKTTGRELLAHVKLLPEGVHVLIVDYADRTHAAQSFSEDGSVPPGGEVILVIRRAVDEPVVQFLDGFAEAPERHRAWLLLTPLSVVGDIVTAPLQFLYALLVEC